ncbi:alpha/beta fold hydrolase [Lacrimispora sp.]|uniref:alpha/beta fold hydrolase n=1 Tax=Lacrimispora sp. TaxID=2719234 RepID=UPI0032E38CD6
MKKLLKKTAVIFLTILILFITAFFIDTSIYYKAEDVAVNALNQDIKSGRAKEEKQYILLSSKTQTDTALIFYPGGKVEAAAYYPLLSKISSQGITCILVKMPFHLAVFNPAAADKIMQEIPDIKNWYIGGHSLGGAMASSYMASHPDSLNGLILLGAYPYGDIDTQKALILYGTMDSVLSRGNIKGAANVIPIEGGNHAGFGNYGSQNGDGTALIPGEDQQEIAAKAILEFIQKEQEKPAS